MKLFRRLRELPWQPPEPESMNQEALEALRNAKQALNEAEALATRGRRANSKLHEAVEEDLATLFYKLIAATPERRPSD